MHHKSPVALTQRFASRAVRAFTILEMMIVIAIIAMIVGLSVSRLSEFFGESKTSIAELFVKSSIKLPLQQYCMHMGDYPSTAEGLQALITPPSGPKADRWKGPYLSENKIPLDPWKNPYQYRYPGTHNKNSYDVFSFGGADAVESDKVIGNW